MFILHLSTWNFYLNQQFFNLLTWLSIGGKNAYYCPMSWKRLWFYSSLTIFGHPHHPFMFLGVSRNLPLFFSEWNYRINPLVEIFIECVLRFRTPVLGSKSMVCDVSVRNFYGSLFPTSLALEFWCPDLLNALYSLYAPQLMTFQVDLDSFQLRTSVSPSLSNVYLGAWKWEYWSIFLYSS